MPNTMTKSEAKRRFVEYLTAGHINYSLFNEAGKVVPSEEIDTIYLSCNIEDVIGGRIETSVRFMDDHCYCQSYYCQPIAMTEGKAVKAARICNYMNFNLLWDCNGLFDHNYYFNEEDGYLFNGCLIRYELMDVYFQDAMNHIMNFSVQQIADVCIPVVFYLEDKLSYEGFKEYLRSHIIGK